MRPASLALALAVLVGGAGCRGAMPPDIRGEPWPEANALFTSDPMWRGGDGAYSVDLGGDRVLWLFGDSSVRTSVTDPTRSKLIRNSVAIQTGLDPTRAFMRFYWRTQDRQPASFIPEQGDQWFWPGHGIRIGDKLLLFYGRLFQQSPGQWGFQDIDWTALIVDNPDDEPSDWHITEALVPPGEHDVSLAERAILVDDRIYAFGNAVNQFPGGLYLARFDSARAMAGDLTAMEWWTGTGWGDRSARRPLIDIGASELSVSFAARLGLWVMVQSAGAGATTLAVRTAPNLEGPWTDLRDVLRPQLAPFARRP